MELNRKDSKSFHQICVYLKPADRVIGRGIKCNLRRQV
jgi:hypothetical protein